jgi:hypothetical protein
MSVVGACNCLCRGDCFGPARSLVSGLVVCGRYESVQLGQSGSPPIVVGVLPSARTPVWATASRTVREVGVVDVPADVPGNEFFVPEPRL